MEQNKTGKYFKYAIGEIVLVVLGILIALSINNWNEDRKSSDQTMLLFNKALKELELNIKQANDVIGSYRGKDSIAHKVINKSATKEDYKRFDEYFILTISGSIVEISDEAFHKLNITESYISEKEDSLISKLQPLYSIHKSYVDLGDTALIENIFEMQNKFKNEREWYFDYFNFNIKSEEMFDYFLSDPSYLNEVTYYLLFFRGQHLNDIISFRNNALDSYNEISDYLIAAKDTSIVKDLANYNHFLGTYQGETHFAYLEKENNHLRIIYKRNKDSVTTGSELLYLDTKTYFTIGPELGKLLYNEKNEVSHLVLSNRQNEEKWEKIN